MTFDYSVIHGIRESLRHPSMITIGKAMPEDAATLTGIALAAKRHWGYPESWIQRWESDLTVTPGDLQVNPTFVAMHDDQAIGFCSLGIGAGEASIDHLWVLPSYMGKGAGRALFQHAVVIARSSGATRLQIVSDPHAEAFYLRMGATLHGHRPANMDGEERFLPLFEMVL